MHILQLSTYSIQTVMYDTIKDCKAKQLTETYYRYLQPAQLEMSDATSPFTHAVHYAVNLQHNHLLHQLSSNVTLLKSLR